MRSLSIRQTLAPVLGRDADNAKELLHMLSDVLALQGVDGGTLARYNLLVSEGLGRAVGGGASS